MSLLQSLEHKTAGQLARSGIYCLVAQRGFVPSRNQWRPTVATRPSLSPLGIMLNLVTMR